MLMPGRNGSESFYRYGFQGQEKDDEVKGEGNSINYKFRMHDPRVGRFFAVDPLTSKYPFLTPYQFSSNSTISLIELEGLEGSLGLGGHANAVNPRIEFDVDGDYIPDYNEEFYKAGAVYMGIAAGAGALYMDLSTGGNVSRFLLKQYATQLAINLSVDGAMYLFKGDEFDPVAIVSDSFTGFDFADAGLDALLDKYKIGKIQKAL